VTREEGNNGGISLSRCARPRKRLHREARARLLGRDLPRDVFHSVHFLSHARREVWGQTVVGTLKDPSPLISDSVDLCHRLASFSAPYSFCRFIVRSSRYSFPFHSFSPLLFPPFSFLSLSLSIFYLFAFAPSLFSSVRSGSGSYAITFPSLFVPRRFPGTLYTFIAYSV